MILLLLLLVLGLLVYAFANGKPGELGRILFFVALFWLLARPELLTRWL